MPMAQRTHVPAPKTASVYREILERVVARAGAEHNHEHEWQRDVDEEAVQARARHGDLGISAAAPGTRRCNRPPPPSRTPTSS